MSCRLARNTQTRHTYCFQYWIWLGLVWGSSRLKMKWESLCHYDSDSNHHEIDWFNHSIEYSRTLLHLQLGAVQLQCTLLMGLVVVFFFNRETIEQSILMLRDGLRHIAFDVVRMPVCSVANAIWCQPNQKGTDFISWNCIMLISEKIDPFERSKTWQFHLQ